MSGRVALASSSGFTAFDQRGRVGRGRSRCGSASIPYEVAFLSQALREWQKLSVGIREQFKKMLGKRLIEPRIPASKLRGSINCYKIKLRAARSRIIYEVRDGRSVSAPRQPPWPPANFIVGG